MKRLMIVADHSFVIQAIRLALRQTAGFQVVGFFDGRGSIRDVLAELQPDVVLVDDMQEGEDALSRLREITEVVPGCKPLLLTMRMGDEWLDQAFNAGAHSVVSKTVHPVSLGTLLREISLGHIVQRYQPAANPADAVDCPLTERELEILLLVTEGLTNSRIARQLWVTEQTVKFHLSNTYRKLGVANRTEASRYAHVHRLTAASTAPAPTRREARAS
jgi:DNA-binding NarL/FixJ family response regulator